MLFNFSLTLYVIRNFDYSSKTLVIETLQSTFQWKKFFGLPGYYRREKKRSTGNPVSVLVSYWLLVVSTLKDFMGHTQSQLIDLNYLYNNSSDMASKKTQMTILKEIHICCCNIFLLFLMPIKNYVVRKSHHRLLLWTRHWIC